MNYHKLLMTLTLLGYAPATTILAKTSSTQSNETKHIPREKHLSWLQFAETDLKAAKKLSESPELVGPMVYHIQQCVEKALKAYLVYNNTAVIRTHNLVDLVRLCSKIDPEFTSLQKAAKTLSPYATLSRYPNTRFSVPDAGRLENAMGQALKILHLVKNKMAIAMYS